MGAEFCLLNSDAALPFLLSEKCPLSAPPDMREPALPPQTNWKSRLTLMQTSSRKRQAASNTLSGSTWFSTMDAVNGLRLSS